MKGSPGARSAGSDTLNAKSTLSGASAVTRLLNYSRRG